MIWKLICTPTMVEIMCLKNVNIIIYNEYWSFDLTHTDVYSMFCLTNVTYNSINEVKCLHNILVFEKHTNKWKSTQTNGAVTFVKTVIYIVMHCNIQKPETYRAEIRCWY